MTKSGLKKNNSSATMATTTDSSTLTPSVVGDLNEKSGVGAAIEGEGKLGTSKSSETGEGAGDSVDYPNPLALGLITMALSLAVFLVALVSFFVSYSSDSGCGIFDEFRN